MPEVQTPLGPNNGRATGGSDHFVIAQRWAAQGAPRDAVVRRFAHEPLGWRPTVLEVKVRRYRNTGCGGR